MLHQTNIKPLNNKHETLSRIGLCPKTRSAPMITQQAGETDPLIAQCLPSFYDAGTTLTHQRLNASCLLGTQLLVP